MLREKLIPDRKPQDTETERLRAAYLTPAWAATNTAFDAFVENLFEKGLADNTAEVDAKWPRSDRFQAGASKLLARYIPELDSWINQQKSTPGGLADAEPEGARVADEGSGSEDGGDGDC